MVPLYPRSNVDLESVSMSLALTDVTAMATLTPPMGNAFQEGRVHQLKMLKNWRTYRIKMIVMQQL